jgi:MFS family permease
MAHAGINGSGTLIALRLLIGAAEAGFTQIGLYFMSTLYPKGMFAWRAGLFAGMYSIAGAFAGLIAYGLLHVETPSLHGWQVVFLVEGGLTILLGILAFFLLPRTLSNAWFLNEMERQHAVHRMTVDLAGTQEDADGGRETISRRDIIDTIKNWRKLLTVICNITTVLPVTAFTTFLPLIVEGMGYEGIQASLMSVPPFVV